MRLWKDVRYWMALRRYVEGAWPLVRNRRARIPGTTCDVAFRGGPPMTLRCASDERRMLVSIFGCDEYRLAPLERAGLGTVIDVGAHVGLFARRAAPFAHRIVSYEPAPATFALLERNVAGCPNVAMHPLAVAGRAGRVVLHVFEEPSDNSLFPAGREGLVTTVEVDATTLPEILAAAGGACDLLKLDVEGAEYPIVYGAPSGLWRHVGRLVMEYHHVPGMPASWTGEGIAALLRAAGHRVELHPRGHHFGKGLLFSKRT